MSKKERLKKQKEKQMNLKRLADLEEMEEREAAKHRESRSARKMRRSSKKGYFNVALAIPKLIMLAAFGWSGFFNGGVLAIGVFQRMIYIGPDTAAPLWVGYCTAAGIALVFVGLLLTYFKKYAAAFVPVLAGNILFMRAVQHMIDIMKKLLDTTAYDPELAGMDKEYMIRYYPMLITLVMSALLLGIWLVQLILRRRRTKLERDNAPVKSIVED